MDPEDDPLIEQLIINREISTATAKTYRYHIREYSRLIGLTPTELIDESIKEYQLHPAKRKIRLYLLRWKKHLLKQPYAPSTRKKMFDNIKHFYEEFEVELPKKIRMKNVPGQQLSLEDLPSIDELRFVLNNTNLRTQAIILLMCSSGLARMDILHLKYKDFLQSIESYVKLPENRLFDMDYLTDKLQGLDVVGTWNGSREKTGVKYITFHTPETTRAILNYLKQDPPQNVDDFLFRHQGGQINAAAFDKYFNLLNKRCGFGKKTYEGHIASHNFRRRFGSLLAENGVDFIRAELMLGHLLPATMRSYYKTLTVDTMLETYLGVLPALCVVDDVETRVLTSDNKAEFERMKRRLEALEKHLGHGDKIGKLP